MKVLHEPVTVVARFLPDGTIQPVIFKYFNQEYAVQMVKWQTFSDSVLSSNPSRLYCVYTDGNEIAELKWSVDTGVWELLKMECLDNLSAKISLTSK